MFHDITLAVSIAWLIYEFARWRAWKDVHSPEAKKRKEHEMVEEQILREALVLLLEQRPLTYEQISLIIKHHPKLYSPAISLYGKV